jgi:hypothetical protein
MSPGNLILASEPVIQGAEDGKRESDKKFKDKSKNNEKQNKRQLN